VKVAAYAAEFVCVFARMEKHLSKMEMLTVLVFAECYIFLQLPWRCRLVML